MKLKMQDSAKSPEHRGPPAIKPLKFSGKNGVKKGGNYVLT
jgi:hypothetical protein